MNRLTVQGKEDYDILKNHSKEQLLDLVFFLKLDGDFSKLANLIETKIQLKGVDVA